MTRSIEIDAMRAISEEFEKLEDTAARNRVLRWATEAYWTGEAAPVTGAGSVRAAAASPTSREFSTVGELLESAGPEGTQDRILTVAYWLQELQGAEDFGSQPVNDSLKDMGHPVANITKELTRLMERAPQLVRQTEKSGRSRQARKRYRLTDAGRKRVQELLGQGSK